MGQGREVRGETWSQGVYEPVLRPTLLSGRRLALASGGGRVLPSFSFRGAGWVCGQLGPLTGHGLHCGQTHICEEGPALGRLTGSSSLLCTPGPPSCRDAQGSPLPAGTVSGSPSTLALNRAVLGVPTNQVSAASFALPPVTRISDLLASSPPLLGGSQPQQGRGGVSSQACYLLDLTEWFLDRWGGVSAARARVPLHQGHLRSSPQGTRYADQPTQN